MNNTIEKPLVTILIPLQETVDFLEQALQSALVQTYPSLEIIIFGRTDSEESLAIINRYRKQDSRIQYVTLSSSSDSENRAQALTLATGEYVNFLSSEELFHETKIERMMSLFLTHAQISMVSSFKKAIDENGTPIELPGNDPLIPQDSILEGNSLGNYLLTNGNNQICATSVLFKRADIVETYGQFFGKSYDALSDLATWLRLMPNRYCAYITEPLCFYRQQCHKEPTTNTVIKTSAEWLQLRIDSHANSLYFPNYDNFLETISNSLANLVFMLASNPSELENGVYDSAQIIETVKHASEMLFAKNHL